MAFEFHLPDLAEGMTEAEVVGWKVKEGDVVELDQPLVEVMSDKATVEIPAPRAGTLVRIAYKEGEICQVGEVLFVIDEGGSAKVSAPAASAAQPAQVKNGNGHAAPRAEVPSASDARVAEIARSTAPEIIDASSGRSRVLATPATRRLARQLGVDLGSVQPTGKRGRVTSDDVKRQAKGGPAPASAPRSVQAPATSFKPVQVPAGGEEERIPFRGMRKMIAENMSRSVLSAAHFTYVEEMDCTELVAVRKRAAERAKERGVRLTYLPFIMKAVVAGLKKWPQLNAALDETTQEIVRKKYYHLGVAAQGPQGLAVTVVRDCDKRSIFEIAAELERLSAAVRDGKASREDLTGSTFTITSLGKLGGVLATPIINFPEVGILGVHELKERPAVVDGWDGAMFLQDVKALLEDPTLMFMEMV